MSITTDGIKGESIARKILLKNFNCEMLTQIDWMIKLDGKWYQVEVKHKEMFKAPPFDGHGLEIKQINRRLTFQKDTKIKCFFMVIEKNTNNVFLQWLDVLEKGKKFDTKNNIRIYDINSFKKLR
jgi:hypothetical protein